MDVSLIIDMVLGAVETFIKVEPQIAKTISDLRPFAEALYQKFTGQAATAGQQQQISDGIDALFARLEAPLPPAQPGDPDYVAPTV